MEKDITERLLMPDELNQHNMAVYNDALKHYNNEFTILFDDYYKKAYHLKSFPTFTEYFCLVYVPSLHSEDLRE